MTTPSVLVIRAAGTNCDAETGYAFEVFGAQSKTVHINDLLASPALLEQHHVLAVPGGFAYGDDVAAGAVLACEMRGRLGAPLADFVENGGLVLGICNGFQVLTRLGLLPGLEDRLGRQEVSLTDNVSHKYEDRWVRLAVTSQACVFVGDEDVIDMPIAHAEGRMVFLDDDVRRRMFDEGRVVFRYADASGQPTQDYPANPNGSSAAVAGLTDATGRVLGLMPHPERALLGIHGPTWTRSARDAVPDLGPGASLFRNACDWVRANR